MDRSQLQELDSLVGMNFHPDFWARMQGKLLYRADEEMIDNNEIDRVTTNLINKGYNPHIEKRNGEYLLFILPKESIRKKSKVWINILLFLVTVLTTMSSGALLLGKDFFLDFFQILYGWQYSFAVLAILTFHEFGHYFAARWHKIRVTLPYYIPLFLPAFNFGTLGAFIRIKSQIPNRKALLDVGVAGPLAGFVISLLCLIYGYSILPDFQGIVAYVETIHPWDMQGGANIILGKSILFSFFNDVIGGGRLPMNEIYHFPFIFAGWIGILVTAINLIPIGQLDGGHILYALIGNKARRVGLIAFSALFILNLYLLVEYLSAIWLLWIILILILIRFRHPPTMNEYIEITPVRKFLGWLCLLIFAICFIPMPLHIQ
jgi:membrane-associated protease RseP (regulator of RpoE activity)